MTMQLVTAPSALPNDYTYQDESSVLLIDASHLLGRSFFVSSPKENQHLHTKTFKTLDFHQDNMNSNTVLKDFVVIFKDETVEEIMSYNKILDHIQNQDDHDQIEWRFKRITTREFPPPHPQIF